MGKGVIDPPYDVVGGYKGVISFFDDITHKKPENSVKNNCYNHLQLC